MVCLQSVLFFWATWSAPCKHMQQVLEALAKQHQSLACLQVRFAAGHVHAAFCLISQRRSSNIGVAFLLRHVHRSRCVTKCSPAVLHVAPMTAAHGQPSSWCAHVSLTVGTQGSQHHVSHMTRAFRRLHMQA
jgi:hypothetical protein